jgi:hypothetical protein
MLYHHLGSRFLPPFEHRLGKLLRNGAALSLAKLDVETTIISLAHASRDFVELLQQLLVVELPTLGGLASGEPFYEPLRASLDNDLGGTFGLRCILLTFAGEVWFDALECGDGSTNADPAAVEVIAVDHKRPVVLRVDVTEDAASGRRSALAVDCDDD